MWFDVCNVCLVVWNFSIYLCTYHITYSITTTCVLRMPTDDKIDYILLSTGWHIVIYYLKIISCIFISTFIRNDIVRRGILYGYRTCTMPFLKIYYYFYFVIQQPTHSTFPHLFINLLSIVLSLKKLKTFLMYFPVECIYGQSKYCCIVMISNICVILTEYCTL